MSEKIYWKGIEEKDQLAGFKATAEKEFTDELPVLSSITEPISTGKSSRKDFLKMLGFSVTAATIAAGCEMPIRKSIPYIWRPEEIVPGMATYYASTFWQGGDYAAVLVKTREGRPIKIEGRDKKSSITKGGTNARAQASVLSLYDGARFRNPKRGKENITWETADKEVSAKLKSAAAGGKVVLFSSSIISPTTKEAISEFGNSLGAGKFEHLVYDGISYSGMLDANEKNFGKRLIPSYNFSKAKVIVSIGCDFLGTWLSPVEFAADYSVNRKVSKGKTDMSRHIQIESVPTITGYKADTRLAMKPSEAHGALIDLYNVIVGGGAAKNQKIGKVAKELIEAKGNALVVCGSNSMNIQILVNAINNSLGSYGNTITWDRPYNIRQGSDKAITSLIEGLNGGTIKAVLFYETNPVYNSPVKGLEDALKKAEVSVSFANRVDETAISCSYILPDNHWLESWNDAEPKAGIFNTAQPAISKLFDTRQFQETLLKWSGKEGSYYEYLKKYWEANLYKKQTEYNGFWAFWDNAIAEGEVEFPATAASASFSGGDLASAVSAVDAGGSSLGEIQVKFYESIAVGDGYWSDNPWLQELPDPVSKICWDNYIVANPRWMNKNGYNIDPDFKDKAYAVAKLTVNGQSVELPVVGVPGTPEGVFGVALGYGREVVAHDALKVGKNVFGMLSKTGDNYTNLAKATIEKTASTELLAITQTHFNITLQDLGGVKSRKVVKETTLNEYRKSADAGNEDRKEILHELVTLYYDKEYPGHHWSMVVDLNSCTGCGACVVACTAENNVPVVGKDQVRRSREMHWLRIDRYYTGEADNPDVVFQPMLCQQCDNAPCENVCPVAATNHSSEGLNQMAYNRCIGTRYCANNCPYKVRRFNWYDYQQADAFDKKWGTSNDSNPALEEMGLKAPLASEFLGLHEPLTRMVLNPDVTVRSRGVMEKCTFCVQRLQSGKLDAKKQSRALNDSDIVTACQNACPTNAITFGDRNNKESAVTKLFADERAFGVIEEIHTMPNVLYLTQVRNREEEKKYEVIDYYHEKV